MLKPEHQKMLREAARPVRLHGKTNPDLVHPNPKLDIATAAVKDEAPDRFHTKRTAPERIFFHRPITVIPCTGWVTE